MTRLKKLIWKFYRKFSLTRTALWGHLDEVREIIGNIDKSLDKQKEHVSNLIYRNREELNRIKETLEAFDKKSNEYAHDIQTLNNLIDHRRNYINSIKYLLEKLDVNKAEEAYKKYLRRFKKDISDHLDYKVNDSSIMRLASLEGRITILELSLNKMNTEKETSIKS